MRPLTPHKSAAIAPPSTPGTWLSSLFTSPNPNRRFQVETTAELEDDSGVAMFVGDSSLFRSPPPKDIRLEAGRLNVEVTPLLTETSPLSAATLSSIDNVNNNLPQDIERTAYLRWEDYEFFVEKLRDYIDLARYYVNKANELIQDTSQSTHCVVAFFWFNVLWTLWIMAYFCMVSSPPIRIIAPSSNYMAGLLMETTCPNDCNVSTEAMLQARADVDAHVRRIWKPSELLQLTARQISAGQAILQRVKSEYEAILADIERDHQLCRLPLAHVLNPHCPSPTFDTESFVQAHYI